MTPTEPSPFRTADGAKDAVFTLIRATDSDYLLGQQFLYVEPLADKPIGVGEADEYGTGPTGAPRKFLVPKDVKTFTTDLASIPDVATWLVPKDGRHTPAALLHDALMPHQVQEYVGPAVDRVEADRIFRNAMQHLDVEFLRRWAMWGAVSAATFAGGRPGPSSVAAKAGEVARKVLTVVVLAGMLVLGLSAWADLFDRKWPELPLLGSDWPKLPGMGTRSTWREAVGFVALTLALALAVGVVAGVVRLVSDQVRIGGRRSWLRALTFPILAVAAMLFAVPFTFAGLGWAGYYVLELVAIPFLWTASHLASWLASLNPNLAAVKRLSGPVNAPRLPDALRHSE